MACSVSTPARIGAGKPAICVQDCRSTKAFNPAGAKHAASEARLRELPTTGCRARRERCVQPRSSMANSSILGGSHAPVQPSGTDVDALGPSDTTDSGSDVQTDRGRSAMPDEGSEGALPVDHDSTSDASGTGERAAADGNDVEAGADIAPDRVGIVPS